MASSSASKEKQQAPPQDSTSSERMDSFFSEMTTTMKWISWLTLALSIGYAILLVQPQPELDRAAIHAAAANYMGISPSSTNTRDGSPLRGLTVAITGATSGIGLELTRTLSGMGAHVVAIGRSSRKLEVLAREVDHVTTILADLTDLESVARAADDIVNTVPQLDILVNNAGIHLGFTWPWQRPSTVQGYDLVFGVNYLSHFLLTEKLLPKLSESKRGGRIVQISSSFHWAVDGSDLAVLALEKEKDTAGIIMDPVASLPGGSHGYVVWQAQRQYANSKLAQILHMRALQRRTTTTNTNTNTNVTVVSVCPSWVATNIAVANGTLVHDLVQYWMFPADGFGLSSILRALVNANADDDTEGDFHINTGMTMIFGRWVDRIPSWWSQYTPFLDLIGFIGAMGPLFHLQKVFPVARVAPSSKVSYNEELQEQLYQWSYQQVSKWL